VKGGARDSLGVFQLLTGRIVKNIKESLNLEDFKENY
jgi:hypothetical protein